MTDTVDDLSRARIKQAPAIGVPVEVTLRQAPSRERRETVVVEVEVDGSLRVDHVNEPDAHPVEPVD